MGLTSNACKGPSSKGRVFFCAVLGIILLILDFMLWMSDPLHHIISYTSRVDYGTYTFEALDEETVPVHVGVYLFNVTNAQRFQDGLDYKINVEEVGPFTYKERRTHEHMEVDKAAGILRFSPRVLPTFVPEESIGRPEDYIITMPNIVMLGLASKISAYSMIPRMGFNLLSSRLDAKAIISMPASDYLWGYDDAMLTLGNNLLPGIYNFDKIGLLDRIYDQKAKYIYEVSANREDKFAIRTVNRSRGLDQWGYMVPEKRTPCNTFTDAYEGMGYPPFLTPQHHLRLYRNVFCRFFELEYQGPKESGGAQGLEFRMSNNTYMRNNDTRCLCEQGVCLDGVSDLAPCFVGLPVVLSHGHFLYADPSIYKRIEGMRPDETRHGNSFVIEPTIGISLETRFSLQVSLLLGDLSFNSETKPFSNMVLPFLQLLIVQPPLNDKQHYYLNLVYVIGPVAFIVLELIIFLIGIWLLSRSATMLYGHWMARHQAPASVREKPSVEIMRVEYGAPLHEALLKNYTGVRMHTYVFNLTNAQRFQDGEDSKLKVQEVGPFTYQETRSNELLELDLDNDVIRYSPNIRAEFVPEESVGWPEDINITMPNIAMLSLASKIGTYSIIPRLGFNLLAGRLNSTPIVQIPASDYLWGYEDPLIKLGNTLMPGLVTFDKLGVLDRLYDQNDRFLFEITTKDEDKFGIKSINQSHGLDLWGYQDPEKRSYCNTFSDAYEGIGYPPDLTPNHKLRLYRNVFCRLIQLDYHAPKESYGTDCLEFKISSRAYTRNNDTKCYCGNDICQDGVSDMSPCFLGLPLVLSHAHYLNADPSIYERIEGLKPDEKRHGSSFVIEPRLGIMLESRFTVQISLYVQDVDYNSNTSPFSDMIIPIVYFSIVQPKLKENEISDLRMLTVTGPAIFLGLEILSLILGVGLLAYSATMVYAQWMSDDRHDDVQSNVKEQPGVEIPLVS